MSYTLFRALYDEFLAGCCYVDHTFAVGFPMPVCYNAGFHMHFVICSPMHTSRTFTVCPLLFLVRFAISCSKHFSRQNPLRPPRLPSGHDAFIRFLCIHSGYATCLPCVRSLWVPLIFPVHYTSLWVPQCFFLSDTPCVLFANCTTHAFPHVFPVRSASFSFNFCPCFLIFWYEFLNGSLGAPCYSPCAFLVPKFPVHSTCFSFRFLYFWFYIFLALPFSFFTPCNPHTHVF